MAKFKDFDVYFAETKKEPVVLRFQGELHHLPASLPVATVLMLRRLETQKDNVTDEAISRLFRTLFGDERYAKWVGAGMTIDQMISLLAWSMQAYGISEGTVEDEPAVPLAEATPAVPD